MGAQVIGGTFLKNELALPSMAQCTVLNENIGILLPKLFWPTVRKKSSSDRENFLKFEAESQEFAKFLRSLEQFF